MSPRFASLAAVVLLLSACGGERAYHEDERFANDSRHRREFAGSPQAVCDAARRALLGQGYMVSTGGQGATVAVSGQKEFHIKDARHAVLQVQAECHSAAQGSVLFVTALESHLDLAEIKQKTSIGLPIVTPLSISSTTTSESQIKLSGETVEERAFYDAFFDAVERELKAP